MDEDSNAGFRAQLDAHHDWPAEYMFKFIAPNHADRIGSVLAVFPDDVRVERKASGGGKYVSLTIREVLSSADAVLERYEAVGRIGGIFAL